MTRRTLYVVPPPAANNDAEAFARVARGDLGALGELYDRYARELFRFAKRAAPDDDAEDVVSAVFERVVRSSVRYDGRSASARPWLFGVTAGVLRERRRSIRRFATALATRLDGSRVKPAAERVTAERSYLDDLSLRRLRHRTLESADATLRGASALRSPASRMVAAIVLTSIFASGLAFRPRLEYASASEATAPIEATAHVPRASPVAPRGVSPSPGPSSETLEPSNPVPQRPRQPRRRKATNSSATAAASAARESADGEGVAEDLAYLRLLALLEEGRRAEAVLAARDYLARFPRGFRVVEVRPVALGDVNPSKESTSAGQVHP